MIYDQEMKKIKDVRNKTAEIQIWENEVISLFLSKKKNLNKIKEKIGLYIRNCFPE